MMTMQGSEMKALRTGAGLSQAELATAIGMARESIGAMERGQAPIELRTELAVRYVVERTMINVHKIIDDAMAAIEQARAALAGKRG